MFQFPMPTNSTCMRPMGDQDEASATSEHVVPIPLAVSNIANVRKNRSEA